MEDEKKVQESLTEPQPTTEPEKKSEGESKVEDKPSTIPYYRFKEKVDETKSYKEKLKIAEAEMKKYEGMDIEELQEIKKLQKDLKTNPELLPFMKQKISEWYASKKTLPTATSSQSDDRITRLEKRMEQSEIDKLSARIEVNLDKLEKDFGKYDKEKLLTLMEEDGFNPTSVKHMRMCFKDYFSDTISAKKKSTLDEKIKKLPEGGGSGGKPADTTPDDIGEIYRQKKAGKI